MRQLSFALRTGLAVGVSTAVVVAAYAWALHHSLQRAAAQWERGNEAAIAHHVERMLVQVPPAQRAAQFARISGELEGFGVTISRTPLASGGESVLVRSAPGKERLGSRLAPLYLSLALTLTVVLFLVVQAAAYWGLVRPLRGLSRQLRRMRHGPWQAAAQSSGPEELVSLSREVEETGEELERRIPEWVEAERRASAELTQCRLRVAALPHTREIGATVNDLAGHGDLVVHLPALRRLRAAADRLAEVFTLPLERIDAEPAAPLPGDLLKEASR